MRIVVDLQSAQTPSRFRGVGRYSLSLLEALLLLDDKHEFWIVLSASFPETIEDIRSAFNGLIPQSRIAVWSAPSGMHENSAANEWRANVGKILRESFIERLRPDCVLIMGPFENETCDAIASVGFFDRDVPVISIFYDLIPLHFSEKYLSSLQIRKWYQSRLEMLKRCTALLSISEWVKNDGIERLGLDAGLIFNISGAASEIFSPGESNLAGLKELGISAEFLLYTGGVDPRKNIPCLIEAYAGIAPSLRARYQLVFAGGIGRDEETAIKRLARKFGVSSDRLVFTGFISDSQLVNLYRSCRTFVFPSLMEGFGLPALEAMQCGAAVLVSDGGSLPEVVGCSEAVFKADNPDSLKDKLSIVLSEDEFCSRLRHHGLSRAKSFSWQKSARQALDAIEKVLPIRCVSNSSAQLRNADPTWVSSVAQSIAALPNAPTEDIALAKAALSMLRNARPDEEHSKCLVDVSALAASDAHSGIQRVVRSILVSMLRNPLQGYEIVPIYFDSFGNPRHARRLLCRLLDVSDEGVEEVLEVWPGDRFLGLDLALGYLPEQLDRLRDWRNRGIRLDFVAYDLLPVLMPDCFVPAVQNAFIAWIIAVAEVADGILCISRSVANEFNEWIREHLIRPRRPLTIGWFHLGADIESSVPTRGGADSFQEMFNRLNSEISVLVVGTIEPRKGHAQTLSAFEQLWENGDETHLVFVGKVGWGCDDLVARMRTHPQAGLRFWWFESASDELLQRLYTSVSGVLCPSLGEGFGLPVVEATKHGVPLLLRDIPVFREVALEHATYFSVTGSHELAVQIAGWLQRLREGSAISSTGVDYLSWETSAEVMQGLLRDSSHAQWIYEWKAPRPVSLP